MSNSINSSTNPLKNAFFLYGTHPIRVSDYHLTHSSSVGANFQHHSLPVNGHNNHVMTTSQSLDDFLRLQSKNEEQDEIFEDARDYFENEDQSNEIPIDSVDWNKSFQECDHINKLVFENHIVEALKLASAQKDRSLYHSLCHSTINYMKAAMTFDQNDIEATVQATRHTIQMAKKYESQKSWMTWNWTMRSNMNEYELHGKLVYAEAILIRALLSFTQDQGLLGFISAGFKLKECNDTFVKLSKQNDHSRFSTDESYDHFDSGVRMGIGTFNLMISNLPQRIIRYLEFAGFSGDRELGLHELKRSAFTYGLRSTFSATYLLTYHTFVLQLFGNAEGDLELCQNLVERNLQLYPNSYIFLFYKAKIQAIKCQLNQSIETFQYAMTCQQDWKNLHHIAFWELFWCHALQNEWQQAAKLTERLFDENNWSKATYCYLLATSLFEVNGGKADSKIRLLYRKVPSLKIRLAGKSIPLEKYAIKQCERFESQDWLFLPGLEIIYLMNGFYIFAHRREMLNTALKTIQNAIGLLQVNRRNDRFFHDSYGSGLLMRGVLLHFLQEYDEAQSSLDRVLSMTKKFENRSFLPANACLEKALIHLTLKEVDKANIYLKKSLQDFKDYQLESRLQFRINAAFQTVKRMKENN